MDPSNLPVCYSPNRLSWRFFWAIFLRETFGLGSSLGELISEVAVLLGLKLSGAVATFVGGWSVAALIRCSAGRGAWVVTGSFAWSALAPRPSSIFC